MESFEILCFIFSKAKLTTQNSNDIGDVWHDNKRISATKDLARKIYNNPNQIKVT